jgi:hypothetical protein
VKGFYGPVRFTRAWHDTTPGDVWVAYLKMYRLLRIRVPYAAPGSPELDDLRSSGHYYGMSREDAKHWLLRMADEIEHYSYIGSK